MGASDRVYYWQVQMYVYSISIVICYLFSIVSIFVRLYKCVICNIFMFSNKTFFIDTDK